MHSVLHSLYTCFYSIYTCVYVCVCVCVCSRPFPNTLDAIIFACSRIDDTSFCLSVCQPVTEAVSQKHLQGSSWHAAQTYLHLFLSISLSGQPQICINCEKSSLSRIFWTLCGCAAPKFQMKSGLFHVPNLWLLLASILSCFSHSPCFLHTAVSHLLARPLVRVPSV